MWKVWVDIWKDSRRQGDWMRTNQGDLRIWRYKNEANAAAQDTAETFRIVRA